VHRIQGCSRLRREHGCRWPVQNIGGYMAPTGSGELCQRHHHYAGHVLGDRVAYRGQGRPAEGEGEIQRRKAGL